MANSNYWVKLYHEILDDPKMGRLSDRLYRRVIELFLVAGEYQKEGLLPKPSDVAWRLHINEHELLSDLQDLADLGIVHLDNGKWIVTKFAERQAPMTSTERVQRFRDSKTKSFYHSNDDETMRYSKRNDTLTDKIRKDKIRKEKNTDNKEPKNLFDQCKTIYETKKGMLVTDGRAFSLMIKEFEKQGVEPADYADAIDAMDADPKYNGTKPTSYQSWAIGYADKRLHPHKYSKDKKIREEAEKLDPETYKNSWGSMAK